MAVRIITDSTADLSLEVSKRVEFVPLTVYFNDEQYLDGVTLSRKDFYDKLTSGKITPSTSQPSPGRFTELYKKINDAGDSAVMITIADGLSGTYSNACLSASEFDNIHVVDSGSAAIGEGILVEYALRLADEGWSAEQIAEELNKKKKDLIVIAVVDTLEYLRRGGRIKGAAAAAAGLLHIKPVLQILDGVISMIGKARGTKGGRNLLNDKIDETGINYDMPVLLGYTGNDPSILDAYIEASRDLWEGKISPLNTVCMGTAIGSHAGPGAIAAAFFRK